MDPESLLLAVVGITHRTSQGGEFAFPGAVLLVHRLSTTGSSSRTAIQTIGERYCHKLVQRVACLTVLSVRTEYQDNIDVLINAAVFKLRMYYVLCTRCTFAVVIFVTWLTQVGQAVTAIMKAESLQFLRLRLLLHSRTSCSKCELPDNYNSSMWIFTSRCLPSCTITCSAAIGERGAAAEQIMRCDSLTSPAQIVT